MSALWNDVRFGVATFVKKPAFTLAALASLALGIGTNTAIFTLLDAVFLRPLPVAEPGRLVALFQSLRNEAGQYAGERAFSYPNYLDYRQRVRSVSELAIFHPWWVTLSGGDLPLRAMGSFVSANYFRVLGLEPAHGRFFSPEVDEPGAAAAEAVLAHGSWVRVFGADPGVVGQPVRVNGELLTVVGVAPRGFRGTEMDVDVDVFVPVRTFPRISPYGSYFEDRAPAIFYGFGRLRPGLAVADADAEMRALARQLVDEHPKDNEGLGGKALPLVQATVRSGERGRYAGYAWALIVPVALILALSCLNVASLLFVRGLERSRELAVRQALGAGRWRLLRQLLIENLVLFLAGGAASLGAAWLCLRLLWANRPPQIPENGLELALDPRILAYTALVALVAGLAFGILPALRASKPDPVHDLKEQPLTAARSRLALRPGQAVVLLQVALTTTALICAGLFLRTLRATEAIDLGFRSHQLLTLTAAPGGQGYDEPQTRAYYRRLLERARSLPGVEAAALSENRLLRGAVARAQVYLPGSEVASEIGSFARHRVNVVAPGFFDAVGIPFVRGRDFTGGEDPDGLQLAIVNQTMAEEMWPGESPVGRRFHFDSARTPPVEVIGVVADARYREVREERQFFVYLPLAQRFAATMTLHVRTTNAPAALVATLRREVQSLDPAMPLSGVAPLHHFVDEALWLERAAAELLSAFGVLALALAVVGVYGQNAYSVRCRSREIGISMALGARRGDVLRSVLGEAAKLAAAGVVLGLLLAFAVLRLPGVASQLYGVSASDPATYAACALILLGAALLGGLLPALRAARTDPVAALRAE